MAPKKLKRLSLTVESEQAFLEKHEGHSIEQVLQDEARPCIGRIKAITTRKYSNILDIKADTLRLKANDRLLTLAVGDKQRVELSDARPAADVFRELYGLVPDMSSTPISCGTADSVVAEAETIEQNQGDSKK